MDGAGTSIHASALREQRALSLNTPAVAGKRAITSFAPHSFFRVLAGWEICRPCCCQNQWLQLEVEGLVRPENVRTRVNEIKGLSQVQILLPRPRRTIGQDAQTDRR
jgi:hypothetical protein